MSDFNDPGTGGDKLPLADLLGSLLLFDVHEQMAEMETAFGKATPIRADIAVPRRGAQGRDLRRRAGVPPGAAGPAARPRSAPRCSAG